MKEYRVLYWFGSIVTEWRGKAASEKEAVEAFKSLKGDKDIIKVDEVAE